MNKRTYCAHRGQPLTEKSEGNSIRDYCTGCDKFFYDNPLPVVSVIVVVKRQFLLVQRKMEPQKGKWCLPTGFAESGESIEAAALRELKEETGIIGKIIDFVDLDSGYSSHYGDLLFATFEAEWISGTLKPGDDAEDVHASKSTPTYASASVDDTMQRSLTVLSQFQKWLGGEFPDEHIRNFYKDLGRSRKKEGFMASEVVSALSLLRKHIWEFALSHHMWNKTIDIYMSLELERRMLLFFDRAAFYVIKGFEESE